MYAASTNWKQIDSKSAYMVRIGNMTFFRSYSTIIAAFNHETNTIYTTNRRYSVTTSKHMSTVVYRTIFRDFVKWNAETMEHENTTTESVSPETLEQMHWNAVRETLVAVAA